MNTTFKSLFDALHDLLWDCVDVEIIADGYCDSVYPILQQEDALAFIWLARETLGISIPMGSPTRERHAWDRDSTGECIELVLDRDAAALAGLDGWAVTLEYSAGFYAIPAGGGCVLSADHPELADGVPSGAQWFDSIDAAWDFIDAGKDECPF